MTQKDLDEIIILLRQLQRRCGILSRHDAELLEVFPTLNRVLDLLGAVA